MNYIGDFPEDTTTVAIYFTTHDGTGAPVAPSSGFEAADVKIYKNGGSSEKTSTNGLTMTSPFDSITGLHLLLIDTSNDTGDSGFWTAGSTYSVVLSPDTETVNGAVVLKVIGTFTIGMIINSGAITAIQSGLATSTDVTAVMTRLGVPTGGRTTIVEEIDAATITTSAFFLPYLVAIQDQTDKFVFTVTNQVDCNVHYVNDVQVKGTGTAIDPWNPA